MKEDTSYKRGVNYLQLSKKYASLLILLYLTPIVFLFLGYVVMNSPNERSHLIERYNERTFTWLVKRPLFDSQLLYQNATRLERVETKNGDLYPVSDACQRKGDPSGRCLYVPSSYFATRLPISDNHVSVQVTDGDSITFVEDIVPSARYKQIEKSFLQCLKSPDCERACESLHGSWNDAAESCNVTTYLTSICYRLHWSGTLFRIDTTPSVSSTDVGCFESNRWSPFVYGERPQSEIPLEIRSNLDPAITASLLTHGCSDLFLQNSTRAACFGRAYEDQQTIANVLLLTGMCLFCSETIGTVVICAFWVTKKRHISPTRLMSPSYEQIFTPLTYAELHPIDLPPELEGLGTKGLHQRLAVNGTLRVKKPSFADSAMGPVEILGA